VARHNVGFAVRGRTSANFDLGLSFELGARPDAMAITNDQPDAPMSSAFGVGMSFHYAGPDFGHGIRVGMALDLMMFQIPFFEQATCVANCEGAPAGWTEQGIHTVGLYSFSLLPSWKTGSVTLFGGVTLRNHPTNTKGQTLTLGGNDYDDSDEVREGPQYYLVGGGVDIDLSGGVGLMIHIYQPTTRSPVIYGPVVGVALEFSFDVKPPPQLPPPVHVPPPM
jgi:hypothetical protein